MIYWGKSLPKFSIDVNEYRPFIKNDWFRKNYMFFAYGLMIILFITSWCIGIYRKLPLYVELVIFLVVYIVHESLHIITVCTKGDLYLTHSGLYFWLTPDAVLPKGRFWIFVTLPLLVLTGVFILYRVDKFDNSRLGYNQFISYCNKTIRDCLLSGIL